jgi:lipoprotein-anchoring transpeptidase ErfK/SrfK
MMNKHLLTSFAVLAAAAAATPAAFAQNYPAAPGYDRSIQAAPAGYSDRDDSNFDLIDDEGTGQQGSTSLSPPGYQPQGYQPQTSSQQQDNYYLQQRASHPQGQHQSVPQGPVMSPDDPRYGAPMNPQVIYSDRGNPGQAQPGYDGGNGAMRPPGSIDGSHTAAIQPQGPAPIGSDGKPTSLSALPPDDQPETGPAPQLPERLRRQEVNYQTKEPAGTIVVDTANTQLYYVLGHGRAIRYGVRVGRDGFTWTGVQKITRKAEWPDWHPPPEMIERQPYLPRFMAGGDGNPLGARAMYLGSTVYRIHGTNQPSTIGKFVSSGCIGMLNEDVMDLFERAKVGTRVVVLPGTKPAEPATASAQPAPAQGHQAPTTSGAAYGQQQSAYGQQQSNVAMGVPNQGPAVVPPLPAPVTIR